MSQQTLLYDGECGMCHGFVKFVLNHDKKGALKFAPRQGATYERLLSSEIRASLPPSIVFLDNDGKYYIRSAAVIRVFEYLGTPWSGVATFLKLFPTPLRDFGYKIVASIRKKVSRKPAGICPVVPEDLRSRFLS